MNFIFILTFTYTLLKSKSHVGLTKINKYCNTCIALTNVK